MNQPNPTLSGPPETMGSVGLEELGRMASPGPSFGTRSRCIFLPPAPSKSWPLAAFQAPHAQWAAIANLRAKRGHPALPYPFKQSLRQSHVRGEIAGTGQGTLNGLADDVQGLFAAK